MEKTEFPSASDAELLAKLKEPILTKEDIEELEILKHLIIKQSNAGYLGMNINKELGMVSRMMLKGLGYVVFGRRDSKTRDVFTRIAWSHKAIDCPEFGIIQFKID